MIVGSPRSNRHECRDVSHGRSPPSALRHPPSRTGLALPAAVFTLAIIVLFIAGSAFATTQEARASVSTLSERLALEAAEYGAAALLRDWDQGWNVNVPVGQTLAPFSYAMAGGALSDVRLTRTSYTTWWAVSRGSAGGADHRRWAHRTVNAAFRLDMPSDAMDAALGVADSAHVIGTGMVIGTDSVEAIASCGASTGLTAGIAAPDTTRVCTGSCGSPGGGIVGLPALQHDSTIPARIAALVTTFVPDIVMLTDTIVTPAPVISAGVCDTLAPGNWGDPAGGACATYLPVIHAAGNLTLRGGRGHGIIIATGDVVFEQGATFAGLVIAGDDFVTGNGGGSVLGAVLAGDGRRGPQDHSMVTDGGLVRRSTCRVRLARLAAAPPMRVRDRWWAEFD